jgi:hypothetical protein
MFILGGRSLREVCFQEEKGWKIAPCMIGDEQMWNLTLQSSSEMVVEE